MAINREGFWSTGMNSKLPTPEVGSHWPGEKEFIEKLEEIEGFLNAGQRFIGQHAQVLQMKGWSTCRICGIMNGTREYELGTWAWPEGYIHYIKEHLVQPSLAFREFILGYHIK